MSASAPGAVFINDYKCMAELKNIRIAISGIYDYAYEELPSLRVPFLGNGAPEWVEKKHIYKIYRPASVLAAACDKFSMLPLTHHHPKVPVDSANFRDLIIGYTGENPWIDYLNSKDEVGIRSTVLLYDDEALDAYERGEIQLSPGYIANFEWQQGTDPHGNPYDIIMKEITEVNHLALLPAGRGGEDAVVMDQECTKDNEEFEQKHKRDSSGKFSSVASSKISIEDLEDLGHGDVKNPIPMAEKEIILTATQKLNTARKEGKEKYKEKEVNVSDLETRQDWLDRSKLEDLSKGFDAKRWKGDTIRAVEVNGHYVLIDGNHRSATAKINGEKTLKIDVLTEDSGFSIFDIVQDRESKSIFELVAQQCVN